MMNKYSKISSLLIFSMIGSVYAEDNIFELDLEQLMEIEIISIAKMPQSIRQTAAAIHVISSSDIQYSGVSTLPELLRSVPGLYVAQIDASKWAVSIRGMTSRFSNKLLVLVDGRSVYTPIFSGVYWNMQDMPLDNIERIEIVRGTGGSLWGTNAVNGVVNIITKNAADTQGSGMSLAAGSTGELVTAWFGDKINEDINYRIYAKEMRVNSFKDSVDYPAHDDWQNLNVGFRLDSQQEKDNSWLLEGGVVKGEAEQTTSLTSLTPPSISIIDDHIDYTNGHILFRLNKPIAEDNVVQIQTYMDSFERTSTDITHKVLTYDLDIQQQLQWAEDYSLIWGVGYRVIDDNLEPGFTVSFSPEKKHTSTLSMFLQGEKQLSEDLRFTLGTKLEKNDISGIEYQPSARFIWELSPLQSLWAAASRAVRVPSRSDSDLRINFLVLDADPAAGPFAAPTVFSIMGNPEVKAEVVESFELGYRGLINPSLSIDVSAFSNHYHSLTSQSSSVDFEFDPLPPHLLIANTVGNDLEANTSGVEISIIWQASEQWKVSANHSWFVIDANYIEGSAASLGRLEVFENSEPQNQSSIHSIWNATDALTLTTGLYHVAAVKGVDVDAYTRLDAGLIWHIKSNVTLSLTGMNLLDKQHKEYEAPDAFYTEIPRSVYLKLATYF